MPNRASLFRLAEDLNTVAAFLARRDISEPTPQALEGACGKKKADLLILFGGSLPYGGLTAGKAYLAGLAHRLMIVGGEGHTTPFLRRAVHEKHPDIRTEGCMEADIFLKLLQKELGISPAEVLVERRSQNCGENAIFALETIKQAGLTPKTVLLMQDSSMQQRMDAVFRKTWTDFPCAFLSYAAYLPRIAVRDGRLVFDMPEIWGMWEMEQFITLTLGEIPRLWDTAEGYGPNGKGYIIHVDIPQPVLSAFLELREQFGALVRKPWEKTEA